MTNILDTLKNCSTYKRKLLAKFLFPRHTKTIAENFKDIDINILIDIKDYLNWNSFYYNIDVNYVEKALFLFPNTANDYIFRRVLSSRNFLPIELIRKYKKRLNWNGISVHNQHRETYLTHGHLINWRLLSATLDINSCAFLCSKIKINMFEFSSRTDLTQEILIIYRERLNWELVSRNCINKNKNLIHKAFVDKIRWEFVDDIPIDMVETYNIDLKHVFANRTSLIEEKTARHLLTLKKDKDLSIIHISLTENIIIDHRNRFDYSEIAKNPTLTEKIVVKSLEFIPWRYLIGHPAVESPWNNFVLSIKEKDEWICDAHGKQIIPKQIITQRCSYDFFALKSNIETSDILLSHDILQYFKLVLEYV